MTSRRRKLLAVAGTVAFATTFSAIAMPTMAQDQTTTAAPDPAAATNTGTTPPAVTATDTGPATTSTATPAPTTTPTTSTPARSPSKGNNLAGQSRQGAQTRKRSSSSSSRRRSTRRHRRSKRSTSTQAACKAQQKAAADAAARARRLARRRKQAAAAGSAGSAGTSAARSFTGGSGGPRLPSLAKVASSKNPCPPDQQPSTSSSANGGSTSSTPTGTTPDTTAQAPTASNPTLSVAAPAPAPLGVPNFFINKFQIPPFLLPLYQAAGIQYNIPWQVLAGINEIETDYGRNLSVSSAGARGWMQFLPSSWKTYGVDANNDGRKDPYNPADAIFAAARYLKAAGGDKNIKQAIFSYNHANWYVQSVLLRAKLIGGLPAGLVGSLTGLTQGHFPVHARAKYADNHRDSTNIFAANGSPVIAVQDGVVRKVGTSAARGKYVVLQDAYGNRYTYAHLGSVQSDYPVPKPQHVTPADVNAELKLPNDPAPTRAASAGRQSAPKVEAESAKDKAATKTRTPAHGAAAQAAPAATGSAAATGPTVAVQKERLYAHPARGGAFQAGGKQQLFEAGKLPGFTTFSSFFTGVFGLNRSDVELQPLKPGAKVIAGTILGRLGEHAQASPHLQFSIQPAGKGAPQVDPKPILDGWKLLESTAIYRAAGKNPFFGSNGRNPTIGQVLLMSKEQLQTRVLEDPRVDIYACGRQDIQSGQIDRRVLATLEFLANSGLKPTVTALKCGHSELTASGNVSEHITGDAVDIGAVNGIPILDHQGKGSITDMTIQRLLTLQGTMKAHQIISLMGPEDFGGADNVLSLPDHNDHIHIGFHPLGAAGGDQALLKPRQWPHLIDQLAHLQNPTVPTRPSKDAIPAGQ